MLSSGLSMLAKSFLSFYSTTASCWNYFTTDSWLLLFHFCGFVRIWLTGLEIYRISGRILAIRWYPVSGKTIQHFLPYLLLKRQWSVRQLPRRQFRATRTLLAALMTLCFTWLYSPKGVAIDWLGSVTLYSRLLNFAHPVKRAAPSGQYTYTYSLSVS